MPAKVIWGLTVYARLSMMRKPSSLATSPGKEKIKDQWGPSSVRWHQERWAASDFIRLSLSPSILYQTFNIGTGFSDRQRQNPPKVGSIVVYRFQELTRDGVPRYVSCTIFWKMA